MNSSANNNSTKTAINYSLFPEEEQEIYIFIRRLSIKYNINSTFITKQILTSLINKTLPKNELSETSKIAAEIFGNLSQSKTSTLALYEFVKDIQRKRNKIEIPKNSTEKFYKTLYHSLLTKSEGIIYHLKHLQQRKWISQNQNLYNYLSWSILTVTGGDLYDLDSDQIKIKQIHSNSSTLQASKTAHKAKILDATKNSGLAYLAKYSNLENNAHAENDFLIIRTNSKKYGTQFNYDSIHSSGLNNDKNAHNKRRSTNLTSIASPSIIARLYSQMSKIDTIDFDIFDLDDIVGKKSTIYVATEILSKFDLVEQEIIPSEILRNFVETIVNGYDRENALYHNDLHGGDVMQTVFTMFIKGDLQSKMFLGQLDSFATIIGALCHDFKHTGQNNLFHINSKSKIAIRYNDFSVLENYHIAQTFKVLNRKECNIFKTFTPEEFRICRKRMIRSILATDMANHQAVLSNIKAKIATFNIMKGKNFEMIFKTEENQTNLSKLFDAQQSVLNMIVHSADISNPAKPDKISENWTKRVYDEFFVQGDLEKKLGLPVSNFCDRETTNINKAMIGFIDFVVLPTFELLSTLIYETSEYRDHCKANLKKYLNNVKKEERKAKLKPREKTSKNK